MGLRILNRNLALLHGELDVIACDAATTVVFVEVRHTGDGYGGSRTRRPSARFAAVAWPGCGWPTRKKRWAAVRIVLIGVRVGQRSGRTPRLTRRGSADGAGACLGRSAGAGRRDRKSKPTSPQDCRVCIW